MSPTIYTSLDEARAVVMFAHPKRRRIALFALIAIAAAAGYGWLTFGVFSDREFGTLYLFRKHRLSARFFFGSPIGESDRQLHTLSPRKQRAEVAFREFVEQNGGYYRKHRLFP